MNIILLSGGSGKRLWPLSNDIQSKQFLPLLKNDEGDYESMLQRVYHQINSVDINARITIATSEAQVDLIRKQLGNNISLCIEPFRRDTFPAIALAAAYIHYECNLSLDEIAIVCPVDPYVDISYYEALKELEHLAQNNTTSITLMGINPTYPSEKYGYIIPTSSDKISSVEAFKEKPSTEKAEKYIEQSALWNSGVFAFHLGCFLEKAHSLIDFVDYKDLYSKYENLKKISFDYAILEKESNIKVMRYSGDWQDIGTWNKLTEVMDYTAKGEVVFDAMCKNTKVINETALPIICMGCENMIVVASKDGILISEKERSAHIKPYVEKIDLEGNKGKLESP